MPRLPLIPTVVVGICIAAMIALGVWQLQRRGEKAQALVLYAQNLDKPSIDFPRIPVGDEHLFRHASAFCLEVVGWQARAGRDRKGMVGWRQIAECRTGAEGPLLLIDVGVTQDAAFKPQWGGGPITGTITHAPDGRSMLGQIFDHTPKSLMLIADLAAPGLSVTVKPDLSSVPNNHLAYAVQWFLFAGVAAIIYLLALMWREKKFAPPPPPA